MAANGRGTAVLAGAAGLAVVGALLVVWFFAPAEGVMGTAQRIFYFHVPAAWGMYLATGLCSIASVVYLANGSERADAFAAAAGSVALLFCGIVMVTGPLWARAAWGTFWVWEARLTTLLVLALILAAYAILRRASERTPSLAKFAAVLAVLGAVDVPLIHVAVRKWRGNHPTVLGRGGGGIEPEMWVALAASLAAFTLLLAALLGLRYRLERARRDCARLQAEILLGASNGPGEGR